MYLPQTLPLCEPHVFNWVGASGRRYEFAVSRPSASWLDQAAIFVLVKRNGDEMEVLYVGHACSLQQRFGFARERCPEIWRRALAAGMTHIHLRFEACSERERLAEVRDLRAALRQTLDESREPEPDWPGRDPEVERPSAGADDVLVPFRAKLKATRNRDPHVDLDPFTTDSLPSNLPLGHAFEPPKLHRPDPAREPAFDEGAAGEDDVIMIREHEREDKPESAGQQLAGAVALPAQPEVKADVVDEPRLETVPADAVQRPAVADDEPAAAAPEVGAAVAVVASDQESGRESRRESRRGSGIFSRLLGVATARCRQWLSARPESVPLSPTSTISPESSSLQDLQTAGSLGQVAPEESGPFAEICEVQPTAERVATGSPAEVLQDGAEVASAEPPAAPVSGSEEQPAIVLAMKEEPSAVAEAPPAVVEEALESPTAHPAVGPEVRLESVRAVKRSLDLEPSGPLVLFAGALSYDAGADIFADALITVSSGDPSAQFLFIGEGPLRGELQERLQASGLGGRCRFVGDVPTERFEQLLEACNFVVIPARVSQREDLARHALLFGKPVLVTHQSGIQCVEHGKTGLITYDNPGSFVWGIRELLGPLGVQLGGMHAVAA